MRVYCIKTKYNKNDLYGLDKPTDYVLFKKGHFYEYVVEGLWVKNSDGLLFSFDHIVLSISKFNIYFFIMINTSNSSDNIISFFF